MFVNELEGYFGVLGESEKKWITENLEHLDEESKMNVFTELKKKGSISITALQEVFQKVSGKKPRKYYWSICMVCGTEYGYGLPYCPGCHEKGVLTRRYYVKVSDFQPPAKVIRFNKEYLGDGKEPVCYTCKEREMSFCTHFGKEGWECRDYRNCKCASCCIKNKRENERLSKL